MGKVVVWQSATGAILVTRPARPQGAGESEAQYLDAIAAAAMEKAPGTFGTCTRLANADEAALPATRRWRNQWRHAAGVVAPDVPLCRAARLAEVRAERDARLQASDGPALRANEQGTAQRQAAWRTYRQALRDLPATAQTAIAACRTPDEVASYSPTWPTAPE